MPVQRYDSKIKIMPASSWQHGYLDGALSYASQVDDGWLLVLHARQSFSIAVRCKTIC